MSIPILVGLIAVLLIVVVGMTMRGGNTRSTGTGEAPTAAGQQSGMIVLVLVIAAGLILYFVFGR